jgi:hypothetical protein
MLKILKLVQIRICMHKIIYIYIEREREREREIEQKKIPTSMLH